MACALTGKVLWEFSTILNVKVYPPAFALDYQVEADAAFAGPVTLTEHTAI